VAPINQQLASNNEDSSSDNVDVDRSCKEPAVDEEDDDESDKSKKSEPVVDVGVTKVNYLLF
jgi:hypothetical protein